MTSARNHHSAFRPPTVSRSQSTRGRTPQLSRFHIPRIPRMPETSYLNSPPSDEPQVLFYRLAEQSPVAPVPPSTCTSAERDSLEFELYKKKIEEELDRVAAEKLQLSPKRHRSYAELETTVPFSIKNQVTQLDPKAVHIMARPRSPHRKSEQESEQLQHLLDQQLLSVRQQLVSSPYRVS